MFLLIYYLYVYIYACVCVFNNGFVDFYEEYIIVVSNNPKSWPPSIVPKQSVVE